MEPAMIRLNDGYEMPQLGLGVWQAKDGNETYDAVLTAIKSGYRLIDTAMVYLNEESVGQAIADSGVPRQELFITTKLWNSDQGDAATVRAACQKSLERLKLDYVDLYLIHWPTPKRDLYLETWNEFERLKTDGLVRSIGVSNFRIEDLQTLIDQSGTVPAVNQIELHPYLQQTELRQFADSHGIRTESWSPIGGSKGSLLQDAVIAKIAQSHGVTPAQVVIRWHLQNGLIVIPKSVNPDRIKQNIDVFEFELSSEDMDDLESLDRGQRTGPDPASMNNH